MNASAGHDDELLQVALAKMSPVLGAGRARALLDRLLSELRLELHTPQDLYEVGRAMSDLDGYEGAVGSLVRVAAVMRGARTTVRALS